jgi:hypothetical protein
LASTPAAHGGKQTEHKLKVSNADKIRIYAGLVQRPGVFPADFYPSSTVQPHIFKNRAMKQGFHEQGRNRLLGIIECMTMTSKTGEG